MGLSRRFLNLIVGNYESASRSLRRIDLESLQLFYPPSAQVSAPIRRPITKLEELPKPIFKFGAHSLRVAGDPCSLACYPFGQQKVLATDQAGRNLLYDISARDVAALPEFRKGKLCGCLSLFIPSSDNEDDHVGEEGEDGHEEEAGVDAKDERKGGGRAGSLYLMLRDLREVERFGIAVGQPSMDFEVLFYGNGRTTSRAKALPLPPFVLEPIRSDEYPEIRSYAVVGGGSQIVVSVDGRGTYALDTARHTWDKVGDWTLPFQGKVEYVPEFKLWFGLSGDDAQHLHLAAADLSTMDAHSRPQLAAGHGWEEFQHPEEWAEQDLDIDAQDVQLVNLGSSRFCIARFFIDWRDDDDSANYFVVFTGVEVVQRVLANGEVTLEMTPHKSVSHYKFAVDMTYIEQFF